MSACPRCGAGLRAEPVGPVTIDGCPSCGGLWFDADELARLAQQGRDSVAAAETTLDPPPGQAPAATGQMQCPQCAAPLYEFQFDHSPGVALDACPQCRGIWVDDRELDALAQRMPAAQGGAERAAEAPAGVRERARQTITFIQRSPCRKCGEDNHAGSLVCWACGTTLLGRRGAMLCPRCDHALFYTHADASSLDLDTDPHVDHCLACGGIWLELSVLSVLMDVPVHWLQEWEQRLLATVQGAEAVRQAQLLCPVCHVNLHERSYAASSGVYVDRCKSCQGTWLDRGELVAIKRVSIATDPWSSNP